MHLFHNRLISQDRVHRHYAWLIGLLVLLTTMFILMKPFTTPGALVELPPLTWGSPLCTFWAVLVVGLATSQSYCEHHKLPRVGEPLKFASQVALMLVALVYYEGSNVVQRHRYALFGDKLLYDSHLLRIDSALLGWLCPQGQLALCLDTHQHFGVKTAVGMVVAELLQAMYVSYYFWGNILGGWLAFHYFIVTQLLGRNNTVSSRKRQWRHIQMFLCAWVGGFLANFILNMIFPAVSPRIHLNKSYQNEIQGFFIANSLRAAITSAAAQTYSAFPSGHCGLSWLVPIMAYRMGYKRYAVVTAIAATLISGATLLLRYHYFADFLFSVFVVYWGAWFGGFHTAACYEASLKGDWKEEEKDRKGRQYNEDEFGSDGEDGDSDMQPLMQVAVDKLGGSAGSSGGADGSSAAGGGGGQSGGTNAGSPRSVSADGKRDGGSGGMGLRLEGLTESAHESEDGEVEQKTPRDGGEQGTLIRLSSSAAIPRQMSQSKQNAGSRE